MATAAIAIGSKRVAKAKKRQGKRPNLLQRMADREWVERQRDVCDIGPVVTPETAQHGDYVPAAKTGPMRRALTNQGGTPIARWKSAGLLSDQQQAAIDHCIRLWGLIDAGPRLVANLDRTVFGCPGDGNVAEIEARSDLHRIKAGFPLRYWDVFENVCRHDEPAGVAGSRLAEDDVTRRTMARTIVCMVADMIYMRERLSY